jgi:hypothetical protein
VLIGRNLRKAVSQGIAFAAFRWIAIWLLVGACASYGEPFGTVGAIVIIAVDIIAHSSFSGRSLLNADQQRRQWVDTLTNRIFYRLLLENIRAAGSNGVDVDELFRTATQEATEDIRKADEDSKIDSGWLDSKAWHWFGGLLSFVGQVVVYWVYYGSAFWLFAKR